MRIGSICLAGGLAAFAWSVSAQTLGDDTAGPYLAELGRQCPQRQLQLLSPANLRDGLDNFIAGLPPNAQDSFVAADKAQCSSQTGGAACVNLADISAAETQGLTENLARSICGDFLRCRAQGDCDTAR